MVEIRLEIEGIPVSWLAHAGYGRRAYNPRFNEKAYVIHTIKQQYRFDPLFVPVSITYRFYMPIPTSLSQKKKDKMAIGAIHHTKKPDVSNLTKFYEDCLKNLVIKDDSQVTRSIASKEYSEHPRTVINIHY